MCCALSPLGAELGLSPWEEEELGKDRGTLEHLGLSRRAGCRAKSSLWPKRLLTHIWYHEWHFTSLSCQNAKPSLFACVRAGFGPACIIYVGY